MHHHARTALICVAPGAAILSTDDAKAHLRVDSADDDDWIEAACSAATSALDGADGKLKRALCTQTWKLVLPSFQAQQGRTEGHRRHHPREIELPLPPTESVSSVTYVAPDGSTVTMDPSAYRLMDCGTEPSFLLPAINTSWPSTRYQPDAVTITFVAGYGEVDEVPAPLVQVAKLLITDLYENRGAQAIEVLDANPTLQALMRPYQIIRFR